MPDPADKQLKAALSRYDQALVTRSKAHSTSSDLVQLDAWYRTTLRDTVNARKDKHLTVEELGKLMDWKLAHGKWRPRLQEMSRSNPAALVQSTTSQASSLPAPAALKELCKLKAVGPATASAILALWDPSTQPFLSDEAYDAMGLGKPDYTPKCWARLVEVMQGRVERGEWEGGVEELERACWAWGVEKKYGGGGPREEVEDARGQSELEEAKEIAHEGAGKTKVVGTKRGKETVAKADADAVEEDEKPETRRRSKRVKKE